MEIVPIAFLARWPSKLPWAVRPESGPLREVKLVRLAQGSLRGREVRISLHRLLDQAVELGGLEDRPPLRRNIHRGDEALRVPPIPGVEAVSPCAGALP